MQEVSLLRLYILRAMYLFIVAGLGVFLWPGLLDPTHHESIVQGQANYMLAAFSILCAIGIRYPLQMLPVLLWEVTWKTMWLLLVPFPQWLHGHIDDSLQPAVFACSLVVLVYLAIPWGYVFKRYVMAPGAAWARQGRASS